MTVINKSPAPRQPSGMRAFVIVWLGQVVSLFGSSMTAFALTIWAWTETGEATALSLAALFNFGPAVLLSPVAGALVDRWDRKLVMMLSDLGAGLSTVAIFLLLSADSLQLWHIYVAGAFASAFQAFQFPAYSAAVTMMLPKEQYSRASGMLAMAESAAGIFAPAAAGALIAFVGIGGVLVVDIFTFVIAVGALAFVFIPQPPVTDTDEKGQGGLLKEAVYGFRYILARPSLLGLQMTFFLANLFGTFAIVLLDPMILARTGNDELILGTVRSSVAIGGLVGGLAVSIWGGPKRRVHGVLIGMFVVSAFGQMPLGIGQSLTVWIGSVLVMFGTIAVLNASNQAIWQAKVAPDVQGRVFAARRLIAQITAPVAMIMAGPLADRIFEPLFRYDGLFGILRTPIATEIFAPVIQPDNPVALVFGPLLGYGPGAGMGFLLVITGLLGAVAGLGGYLIPASRNAEDILPDHVAVGEPETPSDDADPTGGAVVVAPA